jgi:hypothetical protein
VVALQLTQDFGLCIQPEWQRCGGFAINSGILDCVYSLSGSDVSAICRHNAQAAREIHSQELEEVWAFNSWHHYVITWRILAGAVPHGGHLLRSLLIMSQVWTLAELSASQAVRGVPVTFDVGALPWALHPFAALLLHKLYVSCHPTLYTTSASALYR